MCIRRNNMQCYVRIKCVTPFYFKAISSEKKISNYVLLLHQFRKKTLFSSDITKRMKEITDASKTNRQLTGYLRNISKTTEGK